VFQALIASVTWQPPPGAGVVGLVVGGVVVGGVVVGVVRPAVSSPKYEMTRAAMPEVEREWPTPATLIASTGALPAVEPYRVRVQPDWGVSVSAGVWLTASAFVHCLIFSTKFA
jgi:hypothetical protein